MLMRLNARPGEPDISWLTVVVVTFPIEGEPSSVGASLLTLSNSTSNEDVLVAKSLRQSHIIHVLVRGALVFTYLVDLVEDTSSEFLDVIKGGLLLHKSLHVLDDFGVIFVHAISFPNTFCLAWLPLFSLRRAG